MWLRPCKLVVLLLRFQLTLHVVTLYSTYEEVPHYVIFTILLLHPVSKYSLRNFLYQTS